MSSPALSTRERILQTSANLILSRGFSAMTVDMICAQANITKGGFFHHFNNKEVLGEAVLQQFWQDATERQARVTQAPYARQLDRIVAYLDHAIATYQDPQLGQGCMLAVFTMGLADTNPGLFQVSRDYFNQWRLELTDMFKQLQEEQGQESLDTAAWAELYIATLEGALVLAKANADPLVIARTLTLYKQQLLRAIAA
ncbi:TetR/AcrR family transcriptional regulator [Methylobacillus sp.]|uniref:TetR/AcrR family transcriptional regulator n=1 Tax=Methylobacillus sp. TaxID=56818 RepID=UPI002FE19064